MILKSLNHIVEGSATSPAKNAGVPKDDVLKQENWTNDGTFVNTVLEKLRTQQLSVRVYYWNSLVAIFQLPWDFYLFYWL